MKLNAAEQGIEALKYAAEAYAVAGGSPAVLLKEAAGWLMDCYKKTEDVICLQAAGEITKTYMEMGLYDKEEAIFDEIMKCLGTTRREELPKRFYPQNRLKLSVSQIREVLGYWPQSKEMSAERAAKDILNRVRDKQSGCYYYKRGAAGAVFELLVLEDAAYLLDLEKGRVYYIEK